MNQCHIYIVFIHQQPTYTLKRSNISEMHSMEGMNCFQFQTAFGPIFSHIPQCSQTGIVRHKQMHTKSILNLQTTRTDKQYFCISNNSLMFDVRKSIYRLVSTSFGIYRSIVQFMPKDKIRRNYSVSID